MTFSFALSVWFSFYLLAFFSGPLPLSPLSRRTPIGVCVNSTVVCPHREIAFQANPVRFDTGDFCIPRFARKWRWKARLRSWVLGLALLWQILSICRCDWIHKSDFQ